MQQPVTNINPTQSLIALLGEHEEFSVQAAQWLEAAMKPGNPDSKPIGDVTRDRYVAVGAAYAQLATAKAQAAAAVAAHLHREGR